MATYSVETRNGNIVNVPDYSVLNIDGLEIIGDQTTDWNEPYNKNFLTLDKKIMAVESLVGTADLTSINADISNLTSDLSNKVDKVAGKGLSTEDYTTAEKQQVLELVSFKQSYGTISEFTVSFDTSK